MDAKKKKKEVEDIAGSSKQFAAEPASNTVDERQNGNTSSSNHEGNGLKLKTISNTIAAYGEVLRDTLNGDDIDENEKVVRKNLDGEEEMNDEIELEEDWTRYKCREDIVGKFGRIEFYDFTGETTA